MNILILILKYTFLSPHDCIVSLCITYYNTATAFDYIIFIVMLGSFYRQSYIFAWNIVLILKALTFKYLP